MTNRKHFYHYLSLVLLILVGFLSIVLFLPNKSFEIAILAAIAAAYVAWGIVHHSVHKDLYFSVILEYLVISIFGLVVALSLILRT